MNRTRSWNRSAETESINHTDNSVGRSQPEALIIHTYIQEQGGSQEAKKTPITTVRNPLLIAHTPAEMIYFNGVLEVSCNK